MPQIEPFLGFLRLLPILYFVEHSLKLGKANARHSPCNYFRILKSSNSIKLAMKELLRKLRVSCPTPPPWQQKHSLQLCTIDI